MIKGQKVVPKLDISSITLGQDNMARNANYKTIDVSRDGANNYIVQEGAWQDYPPVIGNSIE
jgi:hypothetical protein